MSRILDNVRRGLYPVTGKRARAGTAWRIALVLLCGGAIVSATGGRLSAPEGWSLLGVPIGGYLLWVLFNLYLGLGVVWEMLDPRDDRTRSIRPGTRWSLAALALFAMAVSLIAVWLFPGAAGQPSE